jgi:PAS domain S-box-containing protein
VERPWRIPTTDIVRRSWQRASSAGLPPDPPPPLRRVETAELRVRQESHRALIDVSVPHLRWLAGAFQTRPCVAYLVDAAGIVLHAEGDPALIERFGLSPGHDWSEAAMGTNGAGTALVAKQPVAVVGCDHWALAWQNATCLGAPIFDSDGQVLGAIDLTMELRDGDAERLVIAAYAAYAISSELALHESEKEREALRGLNAKLQEAEHALRESEQRFRLMADTSPVMIWVTDATGAVEFVNRAYCEYFGVSEGDVTGPGGWQPLVHPDDIERYTSAFVEAIRTASLFRAETRVRRFDGRWRWIASYGAPRLSEQGVVTGFVGTSPDISEIKEAIARSEDAARLKDEFLATVAHELRQPINVAVAALHVMGMRPGRAEGEAARQLVERQIRHMNGLVEELLDASRIVRGDIALETEVIDVRDLIRDAVEAVQPLMLQRAHDFSVAVPDEPLVLRVDTRRIHQVLMNVLTNAVKYTEPSGRIELRLQSSDGDALISIRDNGRGIEPQYLTRLFDLFVRASNDGSGFGVGLAVAHKLMQLHGGTIEAFSDGLGCGSEFVLRFPCHIKTPG